MKQPITLLLAALLACSWSAHGQQAADTWEFDPAVLAATGSDVLQRVPDRQMDGLFGAVHAAAQHDDDAQALCALFDPDADRSLQGLNAIASRLRPDSRDRFATATADALVAALQSPPQPTDAAAAWQSLKSAGARAAILHDGFVTGLNTSGSDAAARDARCRSVRWLLDAMQSRPEPERAAMTRLLLEKGLAQLAPAAAVSGGAPGT